MSRLILRGDLDEPWRCSVVSLREYRRSSRRFCPPQSRRRGPPMTLADIGRIFLGVYVGSRAISALQFGKGGIGSRQNVLGAQSFGQYQFDDTRGDADNLPTSRELAHPGGLFNCILEGMQNLLRSRAAPCPHQAAVGPPSGRYGRFAKLFNRC
jgi:hypothetical protein